MILCFGRNRSGFLSLLQAFPFFSGLMKLFWANGMQHIHVHVLPNTHPSKHAHKNTLNIFCVIRSSCAYSYIHSTSHTHVAHVPTKVPDQCEPVQGYYKQNSEEDHAWPAAAYGVQGNIVLVARRDSQEIVETSCILHMHMHPYWQKYTYLPQQSYMWLAAMTSTFFEFKVADLVLYQPKPRSWSLSGRCLISNVSESHSPESILIPNRQTTIPNSASRPRI